MGIDAPNMSGANLRQVIATGEQAAQIQAGRRDNAEFQARMGAAFVDKALRSQDQSEGRSDLVVHRQEDNAQFSAGDALNGNSGGNPGGGEEDATPDKERQGGEPTDVPPALEALTDPFAVAERFGQELRRLGKDAATVAFRGMDRRLLEGLSRPDTAPKAANVYRQQAILTGGAADTVRMSLEAALRESLNLVGSGGDPDKLRKLLSLIRQGCRPEPGPGRDLSSLAGHMLVRISHDQPGAVHESLGLLSHLVGSFRDWRGAVSHGMLPPWATR